VAFSTKGADGKPITAKPEPLVFYAAALTNAQHPDVAAKFVEFLASKQAQDLFRASGYDAPVGDVLR
jgi:molybdate/tungstate transport system substrate-binding protein